MLNQEAWRRQEKNGEQKRRSRPHWQPVAILSFLMFGAAVPKAEILPFEKHVLKNGLTVILHQDNSVPVISVNTWVKVGATDEEPSEHGRAHLFEHLMFRGSKNVPDGAFDEIVVGMGGDNNAWTGPRETNYYTLIPSEGLEETLRIESDRLGFFRDSIAPEALRSEIGVVLNEIRQYRDDKPGFYSKSWQRLLEMTWPIDHPLRHDALGSLKVIEETTLEHAREFHRKFYNPNNVVLVIAGAHDPERTLEMVKKWYGAIPRGPSPPPAKQPAFQKIGSRVARTLRDPRASEPRIFLTFRIPRLTHVDHPTHVVLADVLQGNRGFGLMKKLFYDGGLVTELSVECLPYDELFMISATPVSGVNPSDLESAIRKALVEFVRNGVDEQFLRSVKVQIKTRWIDELQNVEGRGWRLAEGEAFFGDAGYFSKFLDKVETVSGKDLISAVQEYLGGDNSSVLTVLPPKEGGS